MRSATHTSPMPPRPSNVISRYGPIDSPADESAGAVPSPIHSLASVGEA
ncbi:MAG: hypothetical protein ABI592_04885 [Acidobacteriota bacterium]